MSYTTTNNNFIEFRVNGKLHNDKGPALSYFQDGQWVQEYWLEGIQYSKEEFDKKTKKDNEAVFTVHIDDKISKILEAANDVIKKLQGENEILKKVLDDNFKERQSKKTCKLLLNSINEYVVGNNADGGYRTAYEINFSQLHDVNSNDVFLASDSKFLADNTDGFKAGSEYLLEISKIR